MFSCVNYTRQQCRCQWALIGTDMGADSSRRLWKVHHPHRGRTRTAMDGLLRCVPQGGGARRTARAGISHTGLTKIESCEEWCCGAAGGRRLVLARRPRQIHLLPNGDATVAEALFRPAPSSPSSTDFAALFVG